MTDPYMQTTDLMLLACLGVCGEATHHAFLGAFDGAVILYAVFGI